VLGEDPGWAYNLEITGTKTVFSGTLNLRQVVLDSGERMYGPQLEASIWHGVSVGIGAGYLWGDSAGPTWHLFVGAPVGDDWLPEALRPFRSVYVEPYYRLAGIGPTGTDLLHEVGLLLKVTTFEI